MSQQEASAAGTGGGGGAARPVDPFDVGPEMRIPWVALVAAAWGVSALVGLAGWLVLRSARPAGAWSVLPAVGAVWGAFLAGTLAMRPWRALRVGRLPMRWLAGRGVCFGAVLLLGTLLYFAPQSRPDPLAMGLVLAASYFAALMGESAVMSRRLRAPRDASA